MHTALAFVHGGVHTGDCWDETIAGIRALAPEIDAFAVDLPGRCDVPADLASLTHEACVQSVADQILKHIGSEGGPVVVVGHSLAGVVIPGLVHRLGVRRVQHVVFVACCMPPQGMSVLDILPFPLNRIARRIVDRAPVIEAPSWLVRYFFSNRATHEQRHAIQANVCADSSALVKNVTTEPLPASLRKSWILTTRDRALPPHLQRRFIRDMGGVDTVTTIDSGHEVMFTHPDELANQILKCLATTADIGCRADR
jgi:pimeloyl-ACP methyl ester carboxylesterase